MAVQRDKYIIYEGLRDHSNAEHWCQESEVLALQEKDILAWGSPAWNEHVKWGPLNKKGVVSSGTVYLSRSLKLGEDWRRNVHKNSLEFLKLIFFRSGFLLSSPPTNVGIISSYWHEGFYDQVNFKVEGLTLCGTHDCTFIQSGNRSSTRGLIWTITNN